MVTDFEYDGMSLSSLGYAIATFGGIKDGEIDTDSQISFNHISMMQGKYQPFSSYTYDDVLKMEFYIVKNMCSYDEDYGEMDFNISVSDMAYLKRWLVRPTPHELRVVGNDDYNGIFWRGSFIIEEYTLGDNRIGAHLTFECDAPFGYMENTVFEGSISANNSYEYKCISDEIGWIYPKLTITVRQSGDLRIGNAHDGRTTVINNCQNNEVITFTENLQVQTSASSHNIMDDFNFVFYRICNSFDDVTNTLYSNLNIDFRIEYYPYAKAVIV